MRVVSLACSNTEIVHALGCASMLVGVDDHSDWPEDVVGPLPRLGPDLDIDVDAVAALKPDLVLATLTVPGHEKVVARLKAAGLPFVAPEPESLGDVYRDIRDIGAFLGVAGQAEELVAGMRSELDAPEPRPMTPPAPGPVVAQARHHARPALVDHRRAPRGRGPGTLEDEAVKSRPMTDEEVADRAPDAVVLSWCGVDPAKYRPDVVLRNPAWSGLEFVRRRRVFSVGEPWLGRPGPRLVEGARALRAIVHGLSAPGGRRVGTDSLRRRVN